MRARIVTQTRTLTTEERLSWLRGGVEGSDIAAICGKDRWKTALEVYLDKTGERPAVKVTEPMRAGRDLKSYIAARFTEQTGLRTRRRHFIYRHAEHDYLIAAVDRWVVGDDAGLLCKSVGEYNKQEWENGSVPQEVELRCQHLMAVTDTCHWWVAAFIGGNKLRVVRVERSGAGIRELTAAAARFWNEHVRKRIRPSIDGSEASASLLGRMYEPESTVPNRIELPGEAREWVELYKSACEEEKRSLRKKTEAENHLKSLLGSNESGVIGYDRVEWRTVRRKAGLEPYRRFMIYAERQLDRDNG